MADEQISKLQQISNELEKQNKATKETNESIDKLVEDGLQDERNEFQDEQRFTNQLNLLKENNTLLAGILDKIQADGTDTKKDDDKGGKLNFLSNFIPKSLLNLFAPIFKAMFSPKGLMGIGKKLVKFVGAPIAAIFAGINFFEGWKETEGSVAEKIQGAMSSVLSGLTFGLLKSDVINEGFHSVNDWIFDNVTIPIMDFILNFPERISQMFSTIGDKASEVFNSLTNIPIVADFLSKAETAFNFVNDAITNNFINPVKNFIDTTITTFNNIVDSIMEFGNKIKETVLAPINSVKSFFGDTKDKYSDFKENFSLGNIFGGEEKKQREKVQEKSVEVVNNRTQTKQESTTNNNIVTQNSRTMINQGSDMSVRSDDVTLSFGF